jgi:NADPH:quinone reductase-like Zn-dependent oxidoreductase
MSGFRALVLHEAEAGKVEPRVEALPEEALPAAAGDVTVAVEHSTLNYKDGMVLQGIGRLVRKYPHVPGIDFAGTVSGPTRRGSGPATRSCSPAGGSASCIGAATPRRPGSAPTGW